MEKCNCGREIRYSHFKKDSEGIEHEVFSCNKYYVCPTYEELRHQLKEVTHKFEAMDRAHTLMIMLNELLGDGETYHPAIVKAGLEEDVSDVHKGLWDIYQAMGRKESEEDGQDESS